MSKTNRVFIYLWEFESIYRIFFDCSPVSICFPPFGEVEKLLFRGETKENTVFLLWLLNRGADENAMQYIELFK